MSQILFVINWEKWTWWTHWYWCACYLCDHSSKGSNRMWKQHFDRVDSKLYWWCLFALFSTYFRRKWLRAFQFNSYAFLYVPGCFKYGNKFTPDRTSSHSCKVDVTKKKNAKMKQQTEEQKQNWRKTAKRHWNITKKDRNLQCDDSSKCMVQVDNPLEHKIYVRW